MSMDKQYIHDITQKILNKEFTSAGRRKIVSYQDRLNICCPYCGDGKSDYKKRGNIYFNRLFYVCFNCDKKTTFDKFCKYFNEQIDPDKKLEMIEYLDSVITYDDYQSDFVDAKVYDFLSLEELKKVIDANLTPITDFQPVKVNSGVYKYLLSRGITPELHKNIYQGKYWKNENESEWIIIMLNRKDDYILGMQVRNLKSGRRRMFKIFNYENLLEWINIGKDIDEYEMDLNKIVIYNKLSYYFNILNIDFTKKITIFEGYLDSLFFTNSIGMVGVNTDSRFLENNNLDIQYFFDNDEVGYKKSEEKIKEGFPVFLWQKLFNNIVDNKKVEDPHKLLYRISKIKDINKLAELIHNPHKQLELDNFFSKDVLDIKWLPKFSKKRRIEEKDYNKKFDAFNKEL